MRPRCAKAQDGRCSVMDPAAVLSSDPCGTSAGRVVLPARWALSLPYIRRAGANALRADERGQTCTARSPLAWRFGLTTGAPRDESLGTRGFHPRGRGSTISVHASDGSRGRSMVRSRICPERSRKSSGAAESARGRPDQYGVDRGGARHAIALRAPSTADGLGRSTHTCPSEHAARDASGTCSVACGHAAGHAWRQRVVDPF
jgi:hypothetical protein